MWFYIFLAICIVMLSMFIKRNPGSFKLVDDAKTDSSGDEIKINPGSGLPMISAGHDSDGNTYGRGDEHD